MENNIEKIIKEFNKFKNKPLNINSKEKSNIGYTLESLLKKREDNKSIPNYKGIEIKTKIGSIKSSLTLFTLTPKNNNIENPIKYIYDNFGFSNKNNLRAFKEDIYYNINNLISNKYIFKTRIDKTNNILKLIILDKELNIINDTIYWNLSDIKDKLYTKINYLAYAKGYSYKENNITYHKYTNIYFYKLKTFENFINLLEKDLIYISFNICTFDKTYQLYDKGTEFKIRNTQILRLFDKIDLN